MRKKTFLLLAFSVVGNCFFLKSQPAYTKTPISDKKATLETNVLYTNLIRVKEKGFFFGHQDDLAYGVNWKYEDGRSDIKDIVEDYPAVYGWDIAGLEKNSDKNIDGVPFNKIRQYIKESRLRGGIITISWHMDNPLTGGNAWDTTHKTLVSVLPRGKNHDKFKSWLDKAAEFIQSLKDTNGNPIPILFRPYHELTGNWFWWCKNNGTPEEFKLLWKFTQDYFWKKGIHNLIYVYNTSGFKSKEEFLEYYPGPDNVDILSFDIYQYNNLVKNDLFVKDCQKQLKIIDEICKEQGKMMAIAETGYEQIPYSKWWTDTLMQAIGNYKISYMLVWRNQGWQEKEKKMHYYAPYKGHSSEEDFVEFYNLKQTLFEKDAIKEKLYKK